MPGGSQNSAGVAKSFELGMFLRGDRETPGAHFTRDGVSAGKESACNVGDLGSIPGLGRSPKEGNGCPVQFSSLENSMSYFI